MTESAEANGQKVSLATTGRNALVRQTLDGVGERLVSLTNPASFEAEQYRILRHMMEQMQKDAHIQVVAVTSPAAAEGKTTTAINLAGALAQNPEAWVLLVDGDVRLPSVADQLGLDGSGKPGLVDAILTPDLALEDVVRRLPCNLSVLPPGQCPASPYEVLKSARLGNLLEEARRRYDYIILDMPPVVHVPDCRLIAKWVDGFLMVVEAHRTPRKLVEEALNVIDPAKLLGFIFNGDDRPLSGYAAYYYDYARPRNGQPSSGWGQAVKKAGDLFRSRPAFRSGPR